MRYPRETTKRRVRGRLARAVAVFALLPLAACTSASGDKPAAMVPRGEEPGRVTVATWNICGPDRWGGCPGTGSPTDKARQLRKLAEDRGVRVMLLQEVCSDDLRATAKRMGPDWHSTFEPYIQAATSGERNPVRCEGQGSGEAGIGLLAASPLENVQVIDVQQPATGIQRAFMCADLPALAIRACNAHVMLPANAARPEQEMRGSQLRTLVEASDKRTVFGGDFNSKPPVDRSTAWIWPAEAYTVYQECDQLGEKRTGRPTHKGGVKLDYLFTAMPRLGCDTFETRYSDHQPLVMQISTAGGR
ncbi:endonuclease/exonuclease/phosphatase family protein [Streptomyces sp. NPDC012888]|uniref:endonuclease/exonuclease/phosphatase family protein n=1 Tax=Streptomyces sp. NPDC012888 TaxID=3364855 RepID=UPI0036CD18E7